MSRPEYRYERWPLSRIVVDPNDPPPDEADVLRLMASINAFGRMHPAVVSRQGLLIAGSRRLEATRRLGEEDMVVAVADTDDPVVLAAMKAEENLARGKMSPWATCTAIAGLDAWFRDLGVRAERGEGAPGGVTTAAIGAQFGLGKRSTQRYLAIWSGLAPATRTAINQAPDVNRFTATQLTDLSKLPAATQLSAVEASHHDRLKDVLARYVPEEEPPAPDAEALADEAIAALEAVAAVDPAWAPVLAHARRVAEASEHAPGPPPPEPAETAPGAEASGPAEIPEPEAPEPSVTAPPEAPSRPAVPAERPPVAAVRAALPDMGRALATALETLARARRTGHRPADEEATVDARAAAVAEVLADALGVTVRGTTVAGPGDAVAAVRRELGVRGRVE